MSYHQNSRQNHNIKTDTKYSDNVQCSIFGSDTAKTKLADYIWGILATIQFTIFCLELILSENTKIKVQVGSMINSKTVVAAALWKRK
jgi:hypothetical protein